MTPKIEAINKEQLLKEMHDEYVKKHETIMNPRGTSLSFYTPNTSFPTSVGVIFFNSKPAFEISHPMGDVRRSLEVWEPILKVLRRHGLFHTYCGTDEDTVTYLIQCTREIEWEENKRPTTGWQVCVENCRAGIEPEFYANDIHTDHDAAVKEFEDTIQQLKTDTEGNIDWLANALESTPRDIRERAEGKYLVEFTDLATDDKLSVYINEVEIK